MYRLIATSLAVLILVACEPRDRTPGTWLSGELVTTQITDWSFTNDYQEVFIETKPWYGIPFSVTVVMTTVNGKIYSPSIYSEPAEFPGNKYWNKVIAANPKVRVQIGDHLYPRQARLVTDATEFETAFEALAVKYPFWRAAKDNHEKRPAFVLICMDEIKADI